jgi:hypothetical protein
MRESTLRVRKQREGTFTTPEQLLLFETEEGDFAEEANEETREVQNYSVALEWASREMKQLPIGSRLIRGVQERLLQHVRGADKYPGEFAPFKISLAVVRIHVTHVSYLLCPVGYLS